MTNKALKETQKIVKDLILFDSAWKRRNKIQAAKKLPQKAIQRLEVYRELVKSSFGDVISRIYPNTHSLLKKEWKGLLSSYIQTYPPDSPMLHMVGKYFPRFLLRQKALMKKYPFIKELAEYEWIEIEIYEGEEPVNNNRNGLRINPIHEICNFKYPIPRVINAIQAKKKLKDVKSNPTRIIIYREPKSFNIRFFELSPGSLVYIELLKRGIKVENAIKLLADFYKIKKANYKTFKKQIDKLTKTLIKNKIIIR